MVLPFSRTHLHHIPLHLHYNYTLDSTINMFYLAHIGVSAVHKQHVQLSIFSYVRYSTSMSTKPRNMQTSLLLSANQWPFIEAFRAIHHEEAGCFFGFNWENCCSWQATLTSKFVLTAMSFLDFNGLRAAIIHTQPRGRYLLQHWRYSKWPRPWLTTSRLSTILQSRFFITSSHLAFILPSLPSAHQTSTFLSP